jgi:hypothetical protein
MNDLNNGQMIPQHLKPLRKEETMSKQTHNWRFVEKFIRDLKNALFRRKQNVWRL